MHFIDSPSSLSIFSRVVQESYNSTISHSTDIGIYIEKKSFLEQLLAKLLNYSNISALHHALNTGTSLCSQDIKAINFDRFREVLGTDVEKLNDVKSPWCEYMLAKKLFLSMRSAIGRFEEPTSVQFSTAFQTENPQVLSSNIVWLCLDDLVVYADSERDDILNSVSLYVDEGRFTHNFVECFSDSYVLHILAELRASMHTVGLVHDTFFVEHDYALNSFIHIAFAQNERVNKFNYYLNLLQLYFKHETIRLTPLRFQSHDFGLKNVLYLLQIADEPISHLLNDLPRHITLAKPDEELFLSHLTNEFFYLLSNGYLSVKPESTSVDFIPRISLPVYLKNIISKERLNQSPNAKYIKYINSLQDDDGYIIELHGSEPIEVNFLPPKFRIWLNYHQLCSHKADRILEKEFSCFKQASKYALEFLAQNEHLSPNFEQMATSEFRLTIVNVSEYLDTSRDLFNSVSIKGKREFSEWQTKLKQFGLVDDASFVSGSGLATTLLRMPLLITNQTYVDTSLIYD